MNKILALRKGKLSIADEQGRFWGFNLDDPDLVKYPMAADVSAAIKICLKNEIRDPYKGVTEFQNWPDDAQKSIEVLHDIFQDCEVIPYIYPIDNFSYIKKDLGGKVKYSQGAVVSTAGNMTLSQINNMTPSFFTGDTEETKIYSSIKSNVVEGKATGFYGSITSIPEVNTNITIHKGDRYIQKLDLKELVNPLMYSVEGWKTFTNTFFYYDNLKEIYNQRSEETFEDIKSKVFANKPSFTCFPGNNGYIKTENGRQNPTNLLVPFVFFVKTNVPWCDDGGANETPGEQYWAFNVATLYNQREIIPEYKNYDGLVDCYSNDGDRNIIPLMKGFGLSQSRGPNENYFGIYLPPFPYYIVSFSDYFRGEDGSKSACIGIRYPQVASSPDKDMAGTVVSKDWLKGNGTQIGSQIYTTNNNNWLTFFNYGLGIPTTLNDDEFNNKPVDQWKIPPKPDPRPPEDRNPGSGGQPGGGTGGGSGIGGTTEGEKNDTIKDGTTSTNDAGALCNQWAMTAPMVRSLQEALADPERLQTISNFWKNDPQNGVISVIKLPFMLDNMITIKDEDVNILGNNLSKVGGSICQGSKMPNNVRTRIELGHIDFPERFGSFLDYDPYTKIILYIPFIGYHRVATDAVMRRRLTGYIDIDYTDGSALAVLKVSNKKVVGTDFSNIGSEGYTPLYTIGGTVGNQIPLTSTDASNRIKTATKGLAQAAVVATATALGGAVGGAIAGATTTAVPTTRAEIRRNNRAKINAGTMAGGGVMGSTANTVFEIAQKPRVLAAGAVDSQHAKSVNDLTPFCIIEYPETNMPPNYGYIAGYQTNLHKKLGEMKGFTKCDDIKLNFPCTQEEASQIKNLLSIGVVIK